MSNPKSGRPGPSMLTYIRSRVVCQFCSMSMFFNTITTAHVKLWSCFWYHPSPTICRTCHRFFWRLPWCVAHVLAYEYANISVPWPGSNLSLRTDTQEDRHTVLADGKVLLQYRHKTGSSFSSVMSNVIEVEKMGILHQVSCLPQLSNFLGCHLFPCNR